MRTNLPNMEDEISKISRLFLQVTGYEIDDSGHNYAIGTDLLNQIPGTLKIRLTTTEERNIDKPKENKAKIQQQYKLGATGRDTIKDKAQSKATVLAFDDLICTSDDRTHFRAHWPRTLSTVDKPAKIFVSPISHIELQQKTDRSRAKAFVETITSNTNLQSIKNRRSLDKIFINAFSPNDKDGNPQRPFAVMNLRFNNEPVFALLPRLYPTMTTKNIFDKDNGEIKVAVPDSGEVTMKSILSGERIGSNVRETFALDIFRATYAALTKQDNVKIFSEGKNNEYVKAIFNGVKSGKIEANLSTGISYNFGPASAKTYLADAEKKYLSVFNINKEVGDDVDQKHHRSVNGYAPVVLALQQFDDGSHYVVNALSNEPYPKTTPLNETDLVQSNAHFVIKKINAPKIIDFLESTKLNLNDEESKISNDVGMKI